MKNKLILVLAVSVLMIGGFAAFMYIMSQSSKELRKEHQSLVNEETGILSLEGDQMYKTFNSNTKMTVLTVSGDKTNVLTFDHSDTAMVYDVGNSAKIRKQLARMADKKSYSFDEPLIAYNPYGTNNCSMYIYFETDSDCYLKYTVSVPDETIPDFNRTLTDSSGSGYQKHAYELTGLVPGMTNYLYLENCSTEGEYIDSKIYQIDMPQSPYGTISHIVTDLSGPVEAVSNGLFFCYGTGSKCIPVYDNSGCLRGELPLEKENNIPVIIGTASMILACSDDRIARITQSGQVISCVSAEDYVLSSDMTYNGMGQVFAIASDKYGDSRRDQVLAIDMESGSVTPVIDMKKQLKKQYKASARKKWLELNSIECTGQGDVILGSAELSGIFKISNVLAANPTLQYIIGDNAAAGIKGLKGKRFAKTAHEATAAPDTAAASDTESILDDGKPTPEPFGDMLGNVSMHYEAAPGEDNTEGKSYYLYLMNNNNGNGTEYWKYFIDEEAMTYLLRVRCKLPDNVKYGSVMESGSNIVAMSPSAGIFGEYRDDGTLITAYALGAQAVDKYSMKGFWFQ